MKDLSVLNTKIGRVVACLCPSCSGHGGGRIARPGRRRLPGAEITCISSLGDRARLCLKTPMIDAKFPACVHFPLPMVLLDSLELGVPLDTVSHFPSNPQVTLTLTQKQASLPSSSFVLLSATHFETSMASMELYFYLIPSTIVLRKGLSLGSANNNAFI